ncbi:hypothetical protein TNCV_2639471 [Trichonephila clavipes]|nr:hypothetical protein TNCV_2639471 [Trichonephila clavipes]
MGDERQRRKKGLKPSNYQRRTRSESNRLKKRSRDEDVTPARTRLVNGRSDLDINYIFLKLASRRSRKSAVLGPQSQGGAAGAPGKTFLTVFSDPPLTNRGSHRKTLCRFGKSSSRRSGKRDFFLPSHVGRPLLEKGPKKLDFPRRN